MSDYKNIEINMKFICQYCFVFYTGFCIYFFYGIHHSLQGQRDKLTEDSRPNGLTYHK